MLYTFAFLSLLQGSILLSSPTTQPTYSSSRSVHTCLDTSFVKYVLNTLQKNAHSSSETVLQHPALQAIVRHQKMSGAFQATVRKIWKCISRKNIYHARVKRVLSYIQKQGQHICQLWNESAAYLPSSFRFTGRIYFVVGYDIGVASPPDILINIAHPRFLREPREIGAYIIHELHHVGFLRHQKMPYLKGLPKRSTTLQLIRWATQSEGMAVHAAYAYRKRHHLLHLDPDYSIYTDCKRRNAVIRGYKRRLADVQSSSQQQVNRLGSILTEMSSKGRLWYQFGAIVAQSLIHKKGTQYLINSILNPNLFQSEVRTILKKTSLPCVKTHTQHPTSKAVAPLQATSLPHSKN